MKISGIFATAVVFVLQASFPRASQGQGPVLKWQHGGCYSSWCETGWYSSPAVADLDGNGTMEVIGASYSIFVLSGATGARLGEIDPPGSRVWSGVVVADLDVDGDKEFVTAHGDGYVHVFNHLGGLVWTQRPISRELRGLAVADLDTDGTLEIVVNGAVNSRVNTWVFEHNRPLRPGWPQLNNNSGYSWGVFNDNAAVADLNSDGQAELIVPSDVHYICTYRPNGSQLPAHAMYGSKRWGAVGIWEDPNIELRGWGRCNGVRAESYRTNFAHGAAAIADVNGDGSREVVVTGNTYDCSVSPYGSRYTGVFIFNADRSRFNGGGFNWQVAPVNTGAPLSEDYGKIENAQPNPVVADLDGDDLMEILFASYDGRVHAFWLDKTEHGSWPYSVYKPGEGFYRFASEPVVADLNNDGRSEVIFASWVEKHTDRTGKLHILDYLGNVLSEVSLPPAYHGSWDWNGALAAPTLANIDNDPDLEIVLNTAHSGLVAYDLPGTADAVVHWRTGRGSYLRSGVPEVDIPPPRLNLTVTTNQAAYSPGDTLRASVGVRNPGMGSSPPADLYFGAVLPDGNTVVYVRDFAFNLGIGSLSNLASLEPIASDVNLATPFVASVPTFLTLPWSGAEPRGRYTLFIAAVVQGALADGRIDPGDLMAFDTTTFAFGP